MCGVKGWLWSCCLFMFDIANMHKLFKSLVKICRFSISVSPNSIDFSLFCCVSI